MYPKLSAPPATSVQDVSEAFHHRILSLEIELRQMLRLGTISQRQFKQRFELIRELKDTVDRTSARAAYSASPAATKGAPTIPPFHLIPEEHKVYTAFLAEHCELVERIAHEAVRVRHWVQHVIHTGGVGPRTLLNLSFLRRTFVKMEAWFSQNRMQKDGMRNYITRLTAACRKLLQTDPGASPAEVLQKIFKRLDDLDTKILRMQIRVQKEEDELKWKSRWLAFQEQRLKFFTEDQTVRFDPQLKHLPSYHEDSFELI